MKIYFLKKNKGKKGLKIHKFDNQIIHLLFEIEKLISFKYIGFFVLKINLHLKKLNLSFEF